MGGKQVQDGSKLFKGRSKWFQVKMDERLRAVGQSPIGRMESQGSRMNGSGLVGASMRCGCFGVGRVRWYTRRERAGIVHRIADPLFTA